MPGNSQGLGWRFLFGRGGFLRGLGRDYRAWYGRDFHPEQIDDRDLIASNLSGLSLRSDGMASALN